MNGTISTQSTTVLTSWKDIARYMGKGVRTVQRWEQDFGLPVRRPSGSNKKAVLARPGDLDTWVALRCSSRSPAVRLPVPASGNGHTGSLRCQQHLIALGNLASQIETSRLLRENNQALLNEVKAALKSLREEVQSLRGNDRMTWSDSSGRRALL